MEWLSCFVKDHFFVLLGFNFKTVLAQKQLLWGESNPSNGTQNGTRVCGQHIKVNNDKGSRASCVAPYGLL